MEVVPLHKHLEYTDKCIHILNTFWPRSQAAREHSLAQSCDHMPVSLAFVKKPSEVIGYSRIAAVQGVENACLIESVIIDESLRGKGFGRTLMNLTENFAKSRLGVKTVYLNTLDQKDFYSKLGYLPCKPVISLGANANRVPKEMLQKLVGFSLDERANVNKTNEQDNQIREELNSALPQVEIPKDQNRPTGPPAPPLPPTKNVDYSYNRAVTRLNPEAVTWMKKNL
ncbi:N-alpha-acetyltransferase 80 [Bulinus truncatus]|nr:N-alpha-acetyltransferase 80 [Bulinus truncatus]